MSRAKTNKQYLLLIWSDDKQEYSRCKLMKAKTLNEALAKNPRYKVGFSCNLVPDESNPVILETVNV